MNKTYNYKKETVTDFKNFYSDSEYFNCNRMTGGIV